MDEPRKRSNLGRGLAALLGEDDETEVSNVAPIRPSGSVPIGQLEPNPFQPRRIFEEEGIEELARSIGERGLIQPILVRRHPEREGAYQIVAGERRWRAAQKAQLHEVPIILRDLADAEALEIAIVENVQRRGLSPFEEAEGYQRLIQQFGYTQETLGRAIGKSRSHVANSLRLLGLPDSVRRLVEEGSLTAGHARALLTAPDPEGLAKQISAKGLSVREAERLANAVRTAPKKGGRRSASAKPVTKDPDILALERELQGMLGLQVSIDHKAQGRHGESGSLTIRYDRLEQLDEIIQRLSQEPAELEAL